MTTCSRCHAEPRMPGQSWARACFALYRRQQRARRQKARGEQGSPQAHAPGVARRHGSGQAEEGPELPSLTVKLHPYGFVLRFPGGRLHPEDAPVLVKLRRGTFYWAHAWIERGGPRQ